MERRYRYLAEHFPEMEREARVKMWTSCIYHGQMALKNLPPSERKQAMRYLNEVKDRYPIKHADYANRKITRRLWLDLAGVSLLLTSYVKNILRFGL